MEIRCHYRQSSKQYSVIVKASTSLANPGILYWVCTVSSPTCICVTAMTTSLQPYPHLRPMALAQTDERERWEKAEVALEDAVGTAAYISHLRPSTRACMEPLAIPRKYRSYYWLSLRPQSQKQMISPQNRIAGK